jgi:8-oxo-dGTP pyrophosphatase MutT (NUDIX family)
LVRTSGIAGSAAGGLTVEFAPTWYYTFLGTNVSAAYGAAASRPWLVTAEARDITDLRGSVLANPLTVNVAIVVDRNASDYVLIQHRGRGVALGGERFQVSAAGFVDLADVRGRGAVGPWIAAAREAVEETGIALPPSSVRFDALCRTRLAFAMGLCGVAHVEDPAQAVQSAEEDAFEVSGYEWWRWEPDAVFEKILEAGGWASFNIVGACALVHGLAAEFGADRVRSTWSEAVRRMPPGGA